MATIDWTQVDKEADSMVLAPGAVAFSAKDALVLNEAFWSDVVEEMNKRAINALEWWFSATMRYKAEDPEWSLRAHAEKWSVTFLFERRIYDFEAPIVSIAIWAEWKINVTRSNKEFIALYDKDDDLRDPRIVAFLKRENIINIYNQVFKIMKTTLNWNIRIDGASDNEWFPEKIEFSTRANEDYPN